MTTLRDLLADPLGLPPTLPFEQVLEITGYKRTKAYEDARAGRFPIPILKQGRAWRCPTVAVLRYVGIEVPAGGNGTAH